MLQIEYDFALPNGYVDASGQIHREGKMRLATAADEIMPLADARTKNNPDYLIVLILARVVTSLGSLEKIDAGVIEALFVKDLCFLQDLYNRINQMNDPVYEGVCPKCGETIKLPVNFHSAGR